jgi:ubiquinone/menaquinone biosynthesis C-methylase UbiE
MSEPIKGIRWPELEKRFTTPVNSAELEHQWVKWAANYDMWVQTALGNAEAVATLDILLEEKVIQLSDTTSMIDFGAGTGEITMRLYKNKRLDRICLLDASSVMLSLSSQKFQRLSQPPAVLKLVNANFASSSDMERLNGKDMLGVRQHGLYDIAISWACFRNIPTENQVTALQEMAKTIRPGGKIIVELTLPTYALEDRVYYFPELADTDSEQSSVSFEMLMLFELAHWRNTIGNEPDPLDDTICKLVLNRMRRSTFVMNHRNQDWADIYAHADGLAEKANCGLERVPTRGNCATTMATVLSAKELNDFQRLRDRLHNLTDKDIQRYDMNSAERSQLAVNVAARAFAKSIDLELRAQNVWAPIMKLMKSTTLCLRRRLSPMRAVVVFAKKERATSRDAEITA